jgi:hypothetical protein
MKRLALGYFGATSDAPAIKSTAAQTDKIVHRLKGPIIIKPTSDSSVDDDLGAPRM